jgi:hypothetical protein
MLPHLGSSTGMDQDFAKISSNPITCIKIDSLESIGDFSSKGLKQKNAKRNIVLSSTFFVLPCMLP